LGDLFGPDGPPFALLLGRAESVDHQAQVVGQVGPPDQEVGVGVGAILRDAEADELVGVELLRVNLGQELLRTSPLFWTAGRRGVSHLLVGQLLQGRVLEACHAYPSFPLKPVQPACEGQTTGRSGSASSFWLLFLACLPLLPHPGLSAPQYLRPSTRFVN